MASATGKSLKVIHIIGPLYDVFGPSDGWEEWVRVNFNSKASQDSYTIVGGKTSTPPAFLVEKLKEAEKCKVSGSTRVPLVGAGITMNHKQLISQAR